MERMAAVDRNCCARGVAEFLGYPETPRAVIINEALEIARKFFQSGVGAVVNGVLDVWRRIWKDGVGSLALASRAKALLFVTALRGAEAPLFHVLPAASTVFTATRFNAQLFPVKQKSFAELGSEINEV